MRINPFFLHGEELTPVRKLLYLKALAGGAPLSEYEVTGNPVSFETNVAKPLSVVAAFSPVQAGSGDPSPENVRPITGFTRAYIFRTGKNLINPATFTDGKVWYNGNMASGYANFSASPKIPVVPGATYFLSRETLNQNQVCFFDRAGNFLSQASWAINTAKTMGDGVYFVGFSLMKTDKETAQLEIGSSASAYEEYTGQTVPVTFPAEAGTVYGGTLDLSTGVLTVDYGYIASYNGETIPGKWISDRDVYAEGTTPTTGAEVVYDLATPLVYQLSPVEILSLIGNNVVWSDLNGDLTVKYQKKG